MLGQDIVFAANHGPITDLLVNCRSGRSEAVEELFEIVCPELRRIAARLMRSERRCHTLQPTSLVSEVFFRLFNGSSVPFEDTQEFFAAAVRHMRRVLTDYARRRLAVKRRECFALEAQTWKTELDPAQLIDLGRALDELQRHEPQAARIVELKFYAGLSIEEIAAALTMSPRTVVRTWTWARAWLQRHLDGAKELVSAPSPTWVA